MLKGSSVLEIIKTLYANISGSSSQTFNVANATAANQAVALGQLTGTASLSPNFINLNINNNQPISWLDSGGTARRLALLSGVGNAYFGDIDNVLGTTTFIYGGSAVDIYVNNAQIVHTTSTGIAVSGLTSTGTIAGSNIVAGQTVTITQPVSGTVYQNTNAFPIRLNVPITYTTGGTVSTCAVALGSTNTPSTLYTNSRPAAAAAGEIMTDHIDVPPGWYYSITVSNAVIGTATATAGLR